MCRLLMVRSARPIDPGPFLESFAELARTSPAPDGDWQGDGWGAAWTEDGVWKACVSGSPIWECLREPPAWPVSTVFLAHARSASFADQKNRPDLNQPYVDDSYAYVFNGFLEGVSSPVPLPGEIGAQKIWSRLRTELALQDPADPARALDALGDFLGRHTRRIRGLNVGLSDGRRLFALTRYDSDERYYRLHGFRSPDLSIVCSGPLPGFTFDPLPPNRAVTF